jgi:hypothetical protein
MPQENVHAPVQLPSRAENSSALRACYSHHPPPAARQERSRNRKKTSAASRSRPQPGGPARKIEGGHRIVTAPGCAGTHPRTGSSKQYSEIKDILFVCCLPCQLHQTPSFDKKSHWVKAASVMHFFALRENLNERSSTRRRIRLLRHGR